MGNGISSNREAQQLGRIEDLEDVITFNREDLTLKPPGHPDRSISLINLAVALETRFEQLGRIEDLEHAISFNREALTLCPPRHLDRSTSLNNLANTLKTRFEQLGRIEDLEEAISFNLLAIVSTPPGHPNHFICLSNHAGALRIRFNQLGRIEDLKDAISFQRKALTLTRPGHPDRAISLINLAVSLTTRFEQLSQTEDLEDAISSAREALVLCPSGQPHHSKALMQLAGALQKRFEQLGQIEDLEDAISLILEDVTQCPPGHPDRAVSLNNLANVLQTRFQQLGRIEDLEDAISYQHEALTLRPSGLPNHSTSHRNLALALQTRFEQLDRIEDLEDAISFQRKALTLTPPGHLDHSFSLSSLATILRTRFEQLGQIADLEDAISFQREALTLRPRGHLDRPSSLLHLANALITRFEQLGRTEDLEDAASLQREALILTPPGHPYRSNSLNNLANTLLIRFQHLGRTEDLEDAIAFSREVLNMTPPGHQYRSNSLKNLATGLQSRFDKLGHIEDLHESFTRYEQAASDLSSTSSHRLRAALQWASTARNYHHGSILSAYSASFRILDRCFISRPTIQLQHKFLTSAKIPKSLASDAASAAIDVGNLEVAVELLEQGRAILWSKIEGYRRPLDELRQINSELADQLESLGFQLEHLALSSNSGTQDSNGPMVPASSEAQIRNHRILSEDWEKVVERARQVEGFGNFLQAVPFAILRTAAAEGPVILINISKYRSDAIILHVKSPPILITLTDLRPDDLTRLTEQLVLACDAGPDAEPSKHFIPILRYMWNHIVSPVVDRLTELGVPQKSRVWWCPTSELCALPLHAAGPYLPRQKNLSDIYISSYIPTLSALIRARSNTSSRAVIPKLVIVGQPGQPGEDLSNVQEEIDIVRQLGNFVDVIIGARANRKTVLRALQQHSWAHFACHGHLGEKDKPFLASFQLHGGSRLTLLDLIQARLPNAELAFLSACHSAAGDLITPDEAIHLAAALQFCGFRSVVGTLWEMHDEDGPNISKEFYEHMLRNPGQKADFRDSAEALSLAIRKMRKNGVPLHRWIMFVHISA